MALNATAESCSLSNPPHCERFIDIMGEVHDPNDRSNGISEWDHDTWITKEELDDERDIPRIPAFYARAQAEQRAISVRGIPRDWHNKGFYFIVAHFGKVEALPCLISLTGRGTFRWAIMSTASEAVNAFDGLYLFPLMANRLVTSMALKPGPTMRLDNPQPIPVNSTWEPSESARTFTGATASYSSGPQTIHGHPSPTYADDRRNGNENIPFRQNSTPSKPVAVPRNVTPSSRARTFSTPSSDTAPTPRIVVQLAGTAEVSDEAVSTSSSGSSTPTQASVVLARSATSAPDAIPWTSVAASWANITRAANPNTNVIDLHPDRVPQGHRLHPVGRIPQVVRTKPAESQAEQMRLVFLLNLPPSITGHDITAGVKEGPIVRYKLKVTEGDNPSRFCGILFQHAKDAETFHKVLMEERRLSRPGRFKFLVESARGDVPEPMDSVIMAMSDPKVNASRRLTLVKKGFFFVMNERSLTSLFHKTVGEDVLELVWLYNGGNATVVFTDVAAAIKMKAELDRLAEGGETDSDSAIWEGLQTTYSKCPCQTPLSLSTALLS